MMLLNPYRFASSGGGGGSGDPYWANVALLVPADEAPATDVSASPKTLVPDGGVTLAEGKFGAGGMSLDGSGAQYSVAHTADFAFGTGDWCGECWLKVRSFAGVQRGVMTNSLAVGDYWFLSIAAGGSLFFNMTGYSISMVSPLTLGAWHYVAFGRQAGKVFVAVDGDVSVHPTAQVPVTDIVTGSLLIGRYGNSDPGVNVVIDELRITKGVARDVSVIPTAPFPQGAAAGPGPTAYQHWRLYVTANDGDIYVSFSEIELLDGATVLTDPSNPNDLSPSQSGDGVVGSAAAGVDNIADTPCGSSWAGGPYWWQIDLGAAHPVSSMTLRSQHAVTGRTPTTFVLQGSASGSGPWTDVITVTGSTGWGIQEQRTFTA